MLAGCRYQALDATSNSSHTSIQGIWRIDRRENQARQYSMREKKLSKFLKMMQFPDKN
jgi:hypothetical protein